MTVDAAAIHAELAELTARRVNEVPSRSQLRTCTPHAALLHRVAALENAEDLPAAEVRVNRIGAVAIDCTGSEQVQSDVRRWAAALDLAVTESPWDVEGYAATQWTARGVVNGTWFSVLGYELLPTPVVDRFGVGVVAE